MAHDLIMQETRAVADPSNTQSSLVQVKDALGRYCSHSRCFAVSCAVLSLLGADVNAIILQEA